MNELVPKADGLNFAEIRDHVLADLGGGRPFRKRGYHRALKRNEPWALVEKGMRSMVREMVEELYAPTKLSNQSWNETAKYIGLKGIVD